MRKIYNLVNSKPYCCVPAVILMILDRHDVDHELSQEQIAYDLDLAVPERLHYKFPEARVSNHGDDLGCHLNEDRLNKFFEKHDLEFREDFIAANTVMNGFEYHYLKRRLRECDIFIAINYKDFSDNKTDSNHLFLIESITKKSVVVINPDTVEKGGTRRMELDVEELFNSSRRIRNGISLIKKI